jgi:microcystin-dependent protein
MSEIVVESYTTNNTVEVIDSTGVTVENIAGTSTVIEVPSSSTEEVLNNIIAAATLEVEDATVITLETTEGTTIDVVAATGLTGRAPELYHGTAPPSEAVGLPGDLYLVDSGGTIGDLYQKTLAGWGTSKGNLRGGIASVNGISGTNIVLAANNITTGVLPIAQVPTGTTGTTVALGNHLHTGVYEPVIAGGLTTQFWRGDKTWVVVDKTLVGLGNVPNVDTTNADNITSGTLAFARHPTGTGASQLAIGNHNHDTAYVSLSATQGIGGNKTFSGQILVDTGNLRITPGSADHSYIGFYARTASPTVMSGAVGYDQGAGTTMYMRNLITNGGVSLVANGTGVITLTGARVDAPALAATALRVGTTATAGYVLTADASGNATWQQTANIIVPGTTAQYYRGDLTWQTLNAAAVGLGNVTNLAQVDTSTNQTVAGTKSFTSEIVGPTSGNVLKVGDDARIADVNLADHIGIIGIATPTNGGIAFGGGAGFRMSGNSTGAGTITAAQGLTVSGALTVTGTITGPGSGLTALPAASLTGTIAIARLPVGTTGTDVAAGNHAHTGVYEPVITAGTSAQYYRGDKTMQTLNAAAVGLGNVANVAQVDLASGQTITGAKVMNNASNVFTGNGAALTALNATQLTTGTVPQGRVIPNMQRFVFSTGSEARPTGTTYVEWIGPVVPTNATTDDTWTDTSTATIEDPVVGMPIGTVQMFAATSVPTNWLSCNGQAVSRTTYSALYTLIGTTYGAGDGTSTFNVPNLQGRVPVGYMPGNTKFDTMGETGGSETMTISTANLPNHVHTGTTGDDSPDHTHVYSPGANITTAAPAAGSGVIGQLNTSNTSGASTRHQHPFSTSATTGATNSATDNMPPYITLQYIIKAL